MKKFSLKLLYLRILFVFKKAFLPSGYPHSVSDDYLEYQLWDSVQAFASSIMNNLATAAIFKGVGVGDGSATVLAATVTWLLKDGTSIIGSLVFATVQCTKMDSYCKRWRLFADLLNDCAIAVDLLSPALSGFYFTLVQCFSGVLRSLVGIAGGATRAALTQHQAKSNNLADVSAKDNSQERMVNLAALAFSLLIIPLVSERPFFIWCLFLLSTATHVYANYRAVRAVRLDVFNANRLAILFEEMLVGEDSLKWMSTSQNTSKKYHQLSVASVNYRENVWLLNTDRRDRLFSNLQLSYGRRFESKDLEAAEMEQSDRQPSSLFHFSDRSQRWYRLTMSQFRKKKNDKLSFNLEGRLYVDRSSSESNYLPPKELTRLQLSLLYAVFLLNYCAEECQLKRLKRSSPRLQKIAQLVREDRGFEALKLAVSIAEASEEELVKAAKANGWRTSHLLISELFADEDQEDEEEGGEDGVYSEEENCGEEKEKEIKKKK